MLNKGGPSRVLLDLLHLVKDLTTCRMVVQQPRSSSPFRNTRSTYNSTRFGDSFYLFRREFSLGTTNLFGKRYGECFSSSGGGRAGLGPQAGLSNLEPLIDSGMSKAGCLGGDFNRNTASDGSCQGVGKGRRKGQRRHGGSSWRV